MNRNVRKFFLITSLLIAGINANAQFTSTLHSDSLTISTIATPSSLTDVHGQTSKAAPNTKRIILVSAANAGLWTASFIALNKAWYSNYPRSSFHFFNDVHEWNQMDKGGHLWTNYLVTRLSSKMWKWTGLPEKKAVILGGISGVAYQSIIEIQDGFSQEWGFSWPDMAANITGAAAFVTQELAWQEQRIQIKLGYWPYNYPDELIPRRNQLFGTKQQERILKDYNSQTYWASVRLEPFFTSINLPKWLNISIGYGSDGMFGGTENRWIDKTGLEHNRADIKRIRRFYLAPDVDLTAIKTKSKLLTTIFYVVNMVKFPAPAVELNSNGKFRFHYIKF